MAETEPPVLRLLEVRKNFEGVAALKGVSFEARPGELHALLGENGAGKSTLMAIAAGSLVPDAGVVEVAGQSASSLTPLAARAEGLAIVYQHPALVPDLTVFENVSMALTASRSGLPRSRSRWVVEQLARAGCTAPLNARISSLGVVQRQLLEIAKAIASEPRILVLDEPTAALGADDTELLFGELRRLAASGCAVVYITHRLAEVRALCQRVTVLRDGEVRGTFEVDAIADAQILELIVGRAVTTTFPPKPDVRAEAEPVLAVDGLSGRGFHEVTMAASVGQIVGFGGIVGNGQGDVLRALAGLEPATGRVRIGGRRLRLGSPQAALRAGIVYLSPDRLNEGLFGALAVRENASVSVLGQFSQLGFVRRRAESSAVEAQREALALRTSSINANVLTLSGGNQQKVLIARALVNEGVRVVLADEPTQGVDVGARIEIYRILRQLADAGVAVVVLSSDVRELEGLCDVVYVYSAGSVVAELAGEAVRQDAMAEAMLTSTERRRAVVSSSLEGGPRRPFLRRVADGNYAAAVVIAAAVLVLGGYTDAHNSRFLTAFNLSSLTVLISSLAFIAMGQACVVMTGGIDLSVGPLAGLTVVVGSFFENSGKSWWECIGGFGVIFAVAIATGLFNGTMVRAAKFTPVAATLVTYIALQGVSLVLRPFQAGYIATSVLKVVNASIGDFAWAFLIALAAAVALEYGLRRRRWGLGLRAVGSDIGAAFRLGVRPTRSVVGAYVASSVLTAVGGVLLMAQVGVGDPTQGVSYTLASVTAVVLGGTSIFGGRGSFVGVVLGAVLVEELLNVTTFLGLSEAWQYWFQGVLVFVAVGIYTRAAGHGGRPSLRALRQLLATREEVAS